jgi:regulator of protease activity HflC (stomatin/prohibitin superfamily)
MASMTTEQTLGSWLTEQFEGTREERPFDFATMITDAEEVQTQAEREQRAVAYAYDRARALCEEAIANGGLHASYLAEAEAQFAVLRAALMSQMGPR